MKSRGTNGCRDIWVFSIERERVRSLPLACVVSYEVRTYRVCQELYLPQHEEFKRGHTRACSR